MICPNCKITNSENNKFCAECGAKFPDFFDAATKIMPTGEVRPGEISQNPVSPVQPIQPVPPVQSRVQPTPPAPQIPQASNPNPVHAPVQQVPSQYALQSETLQTAPATEEQPKKKSKFFRFAAIFLTVLLLLLGGALLAMHFLIINQANRSYVIGDRHQGEENKTLEFDGQTDKLFIADLDQQNAQLWQITVDPGVEDSYRIVNRGLGDVESLEVVDDARDRSVSISESAEDDGQLWAITNVEGDFYRITNNWLGDSKALSHTKETFRFLRMRDSANKEGQLWKRKPAKNGGYFITSKRYGDAFALEAIYQGKFIDKMRMAKSGDFGNHIWLMKPDGRGYYTLTTALHDYDKKGRSLDVDPAKTDRVRMAPSGNFSGQKWKMTPVGGDYFRLTTEFLTDSKSLEAVTFHHYFVEMVKTSDADKGQLWTLIRTN